MTGPMYNSTSHAGSEGNLYDIDEKRLLQYLTLEGAFSSDYLLAEKVEVKGLRHKDIRRASRTLLKVQEHDPLAIYTRETPDARNPRLFKRTERLRYAIAVSQWARREWGLSVNHGRAVVCTTPAPEASKKNNLDRQLDELSRQVVLLLNLVGKSKLQRKRMDEVNKKLEQFVAETLGDDMKRMRYVNVLATSPNFQRRGYGGALLDAVTKMADAEGRSTYLLSSNAAANTEFYNAHGFFTIAEILIGDDDPTWKGPPIPIPLMVRIFGDQ